MQFDRRHLRATGVLMLLFSIVVLGGAHTHIVQRGDTLGEIALEHGVSVSDLVEANDISNPDLIFIGQRIEIPGPDDPAPAPSPPADPPPDVETGVNGTYTVVRGDVLARIAKAHGVTVAAIVEANQLANPDLIRPGQILIIPSAGTDVGAAPLVHVVERGDTLASIAARYGLSVDELAAANGMTADSVLAVGIQIRLTLPASYDAEPHGTIEYVVQKGDRVGDLAFEFETTISAIVELNNLRNANLIRPGQRLLIPVQRWLCPVSGASFINDWGYPRSGGRFHQGNDLFAPRGTDVVAPVSGVVTHKIGTIGGLQFRLDGDDGHIYFGTHLDEFGKDGRVNAGDVVGTVGDTGNARGSSPHLHFEIYPNGVEPINPYPTLVEACR